jgi:predicted TIM-barrel fold metal-dependent hydrolase
MLVGGARIMRWPRNAVQRIGGTDDVLNRQRMEETPRGTGLLGSESVPADHPLLRLLVDLAARHDVPIDLHFDPVLEKMARPDWARSTNPAVLPANFPAFERLLAHNRNAKIICAHAGSDNLGQWTVPLSRRVLATHPNLFMSLRMAPGHAFQNHPLTKEGEIRPGWLRLLGDFPDRFVIGGDQFFVDPADSNERWALFASRAAPIRQRTNVFLATLPDALARRIAQANVARLYKL